LQSVEQKSTYGSFYGDVETSFKTVAFKQENTLDSRTPQPQNPSIREDFSEYVAHLQLHMALQARNLVPRLTQTTDSREQLLHQAQANFEKVISRQLF
jgi:hypothetical protein